jgi:hypothetical protein
VFSRQFLGWREIVEKQTACRVSRQFLESVYGLPAAGPSNHTYLILKRWLNHIGYANLLSFQVQ